MKTRVCWDCNRTVPIAPDCQCLAVAHVVDGRPCGYPPEHYKLQEQETHLENLLAEVDTWPGYACLRMVPDVCTRDGGHDGACVLETL